MDPQLQVLLESHAGCFRVEPNGKITCVLNGHCMPPRADVVAAYVAGTKFQRLRKEAEASACLAQYEPFIVPSRNFGHMLFCALTGQHIDKGMGAVKQHMSGKRFQRAKARFMRDEQELRREPLLGPDGEPVQEPEGEEDEEPEFWVPGDDDAEMAASDGQPASGSTVGEGEASGDGEGEAGGSGEDSDEEMAEGHAPPQRGARKPAAAAAAASGRKTGGAGGRDAAKAAGSKKAPPPADRDSDDDMSAGEDNALAHARQHAQAAGRGRKASATPARSATAKVGRPASAAPQASKPMKKKNVNRPSASKKQRHA